MSAAHWHESLFVTRIDAAAGQACVAYGEGDELCLGGVWIAA